jgi:hypothetical protein
MSQANEALCRVLPVLASADMMDSNGFAPIVEIIRKIQGQDREE